MYLGIDIGTTNSAIAVHEEGNVQICTIEGQDVFPSAIFVAQRGGEIYGKRAYERCQKSPENVATAFKRELGTSWSKAFKGTDKKWTAEECSSKILRQLVNYASSMYEDSIIMGTVITVPAAFSQLKLEATDRAARMANLSSIALLPEPIAASMAALSETDNKDMKFLVYDIGGGTLDLALASCVRGKINIIANSGVEMLGGRDFDRMIVSEVIKPWLLDNFSLPEDFLSPEFQGRYGMLSRQLLFSAEEAKIELSVNDEATIFASEDDLRLSDEEGVDICLEVPVHREIYEMLISDKITESITLAQKLVLEQGFNCSEIDKLIFIGGPTKAPFLREMVISSLGIPADMSTDPMTAVAIGASIYCESREWCNNSVSTRKRTRARIISEGEINIQVDYPSRVTDDRALIRITPNEETVEKGLQIQLESVDGWISGWHQLNNSIRVELPVDSKGDNYFRIVAIDSGGMNVECALQQIKITRVSSTIVSIPAPHSVAAKVAKSATENELHTIISKGTALPATGTVEYISNKSIGVPGGNEQFMIELFEQPDHKNAIPGEPNLFIGSCVIRAEHLEGEAIHIDDKVILHWEQDESGRIIASVEVPNLKKTFDSNNFYLSQTASNIRTFGGKEGSQAVGAVVDDAIREAKETQSIVIGEQQENAKSHEIHLLKLRNELRQHADSETQQSIDNMVRSIRQDLFSLRNDPHNTSRFMNNQLKHYDTTFDGIRDSINRPETIERYEIVTQLAHDDIIGGKHDDAKERLDELREIIFKELWNRPEYLVGLFHYRSTKRSKAIDKEVFDQHIDLGHKAIRESNYDGLQQLLVEMGSNLPVSSGTDEENRIAADIIKK